MSVTQRKNIVDLDWARIRRWFEQAKALDVGGREALLRDVARNYPHLSRELEAMIEAHFGEQKLAESPFAPAAGDTQPSADQLPVLPEGTALGDFTVQQVLGRGAFATVYLATQKSLGRKVALKVSANSAYEARTMASLEHESIVSIFSRTYDPKTSLWLIAMRYIPGTTLEVLLGARAAGQPLDGDFLLRTVERRMVGGSELDASGLAFREHVRRSDEVELAATLGQRLAEVLWFAHRRGVLHLDVKPANILVDPYGRPLLTDFNVAFNPKLLGHDPIALGGTPKYMPPEQARLVRGQPTETALDARADVYALGQVVKQWVARRPEARSLWLVLDKCTAADPNDRFATASDLADAFAEVLGRRAMWKALPPDGYWTRWSKKNPTRALTLLGALPQVITTVFAVHYNVHRILSELSAAQRTMFWTVFWLYSPVIYATAGVAWNRTMRRLHRDLDRISAGLLSPGELARIRRNVRALPRWILVTTLISWLPGAVVFPLTIHLTHGPLPPAIFGYFAVSFGLFSTVALAFSYSFAQYFCFRILYPWFWSAHADTISVELQKARKQLLLFPMLSCTVPLFAAIFLVAVGYAEIGGLRPVVRDIVVGMILLGITGIGFALPMVSRLVQAFKALAGIAAPSTPTNPADPTPTHRPMPL